MHSTVIVRSPRVIGADGAGEHGDRIVAGAGAELDDGGVVGRGIDGRRGRERHHRPVDRRRGIEHDGEPDRLRGPALVAQRHRVGRGEERAGHHATQPVDEAGQPAQRVGQRAQLPELVGDRLERVGQAGQVAQSAGERGQALHRLRRVHRRVERPGDRAGGVGDVAQRAGEVAEADVTQAAEVVEAAERAHLGRRRERRALGEHDRVGVLAGAAGHLFGGEGLDHHLVHLECGDDVGGERDLGAARRLVLQGGQVVGRGLGQQQTAHHDAVRPPPDLLVHGAVETGDPLLGEALLGLLAEPLHGGELEVVDHRRRHVTPRCRGRRTSWRAGRRGGRPRRRPARRAGRRRRRSRCRAPGVTGRHRRPRWSAHRPGWRRAIVDAGAAGAISGPPAVVTSVAAERVRRSPTVSAAVPVVSPVAAAGRRVGGRRRRDRRSW